jgi:phospholipase C
MTDFVKEYESHSLVPVGSPSPVLGPNAFVDVLFGPVTPGPVLIEVEAQRVISGGAGSEGNPPQDQEIPAPGRIVVPPSNRDPALPASSFQIQVFTSAQPTNSWMIAQGSAPLSFVVSPPPPRQVQGPTIGSPEKWSIRVTNKSLFNVQGIVSAQYSGNRPILTAHIDIEALDQLLDQVLTSPYSRPLTLALENRVVSLPQLPFMHVENTFIVFPADPVIRWQNYGFEYQIPFKVIDRNIESLPIQPRLIINDGRLALKATIEFPTDAEPVLLSGNLIEGIITTLGAPEAAADIVSFLADKLGGLDQNTIDRLAATLTFTMRDASVSQLGIVGWAYNYPITDWIDGPPNTCDVQIQPHLDLRGANNIVPVLVGGVIEAIGTQLFDKYYSAAGGITGLQAAAQKIWLTLAHYLLARDQPELIGQKASTGIDLLYAGDPPSGTPVAPPGGQEPGPVTLPPLGKLANIDHIVVVMMENRSFDHMLGFLTLPEALGGRGRSDVDGLKGTEWNYDSKGNRQYIFPFEGSAPAPGVDPGLFGYDPGHGLPDQKIQRGGWNFTIPGPKLPPGEPSPPEVFYVGPMGGFVIAYEQQLRNLYNASQLGDVSRGYGSQPGHIMGYHTKDGVWMYDFLAANYCICDRWYAAVPTDTWPNRFVSLTGQLAPLPQHDPHAGLPQTNTPAGQDFTPVHVTNIFDHLTAAGVSWRYYEHDLCMLRLFADYTLGNPNIVSINDPIQGLEAAVNNNTLPSVTYIEPDLNDVPAGNDDHPPISIAPGQALIQRVYEALSKNKLVWNKTLLIVTYDECGGFYDHVLPPIVSDPNDPEYVAPLFDDPEFPEQATPTNPIAPVNYRGARVPAFVISPWVEAATVAGIPGIVGPTGSAAGSASDGVTGDATAGTPEFRIGGPIINPKGQKFTYDHTCILKTIATRFLRKNPPQFGARYDRARNLGELLTRDTPRVAAPSPAGPAVPVARLRPSGQPPVGDFRKLMANMRQRIQAATAGKATAGPATAGTGTVGTATAGTTKVPTPTVGTTTVGTTRAATPSVATPSVATPSVATPAVGTPSVDTPKAGTAKAAITKPSRSKAGTATSRPVTTRRAARRSSAKAKAGH